MLIPNSGYIKNNQLVNDKSVISAHYVVFCHRNFLTAINQKLGEKSVWVILQNALDEPTNYLLLQGFLHQLWGWIPAHHAYEHNYYDDVRIRYFIDHDQYTRRH
ncbi:hypothetical protein [Arsenophonus sp.]|uniref:hypothetical protein n=1 Tax=Arsenophonus sp. TaxID=1872640 RepID=UPI0038799C86